MNSLKKLSLSILAAVSLYGAEPATINFQGYLTDSSGTAINATKSFTLKIYDVATGGTALWTDTVSLVVTKGVYSVELGKNTPFDLTVMKFDRQYYVGVNVAGDGEMSPRIAMTNVAYANVFKPAAQSDLNVTSLAASSGSDEAPLTLANVKKLLLNWVINGQEASPTLVTGISFGGNTYNEVYHQSSKTIWLDRNLGATTACSTHADTTSTCLGDLYEYGRAADGHQLRTSPTVTNVSATLTPNNSNFYVGVGNAGGWTTASLTSWNGTSRAVCPTGYHVPTKAEMTALFAYGNYASLKLPLSGYRDNNGGQYLTAATYYWLGDVASDGSFQMIDTVGTVVSGTNFSSYGCAVRCKKD